MAIAIKKIPTIRLVKLAIVGIAIPAWHTRTRAVGASVRPIVSGVPGMPFA